MHPLNPRCCTQVLAAYLAQLVSINDTVVAKVKPQLVGQHDGALLVHMVTKDAPTQHRSVPRGIRFVLHGGRQQVPRSCMQYTHPSRLCATHSSAPECVIEHMGEGVVGDDAGAALVVDRNLDRVADGHASRHLADVQHEAGSNLTEG